MARAQFTEDTLVQQTTADYLRDALGWDVVYAYNDETFGPEGTLGRRSDREVVLTRDLGEKLIEFNPGLPKDAYREALRQALAQHKARGNPIMVWRDGRVVMLPPEEIEV